ncbi:hypothetical protein PFLU3_41500 [Pseudomonas fluorescens]|uniref:Uncharacterized protein n=1 Tax=Pseudomonas fluorescens TaxID=294 RepID=A0A0D0RLP7_PSEFL|nr:hypothetical protein C4K02_3272 [Pseudomonas synxantha]KIR20417.1 hypothetical protein PFLU3_41500 [Pseudomonas fluorescens]
MWEGRCDDSTCSRWRPWGRPRCWIRPSTYPLFGQRPLLVPLLLRLTFEKRKSNQNAHAPPLGTSLRLGVPVIRQGFGGPPPRAIHGAGRLNRHPCRFTPQIPVEFRPAWFNGAPEIKSRSRSRAARFASWLRIGGKPPPTVDRVRHSLAVGLSSAKPENPPRRVSSQLTSHQAIAGESKPRFSITVNTSATSWTMIRAVLATVLISCSA